MGASFPFAAAPGVRQTTTGDTVAATPIGVAESPAGPAGSLPRSSLPLTGPTLHSRFGAFQAMPARL